jgi:hypothetical protein
VFVGRVREEVVRAERAGSCKVFVGLHINGSEVLPNNNIDIRRHPHLEGT